MTQSLDFIEVFTRKLGELNLIANPKTGIVSETDSIATSLLPGSRTVVKYYDGTEEKQINVEVMIKTKSIKRAIQDLNTISEFVEELKNLESNNRSFQFIKFINSSEPFHKAQDEKGYWLFSFNTQAQIIVERK
ncbi:phage tail terminator protein [Vagococcus elongatus]|uniref:Capsid protein n=1 Tax=Vagococcus elongatus TaxID=180344 RepID=A0A430AU30_9ENTE|nr:PsbP-related protein [Vagococcus elongatus]RSU11569.1 hypothetical protein CBF29_07765 [Vagococcus elongatus]